MDGVIIDPVYENFSVTAFIIVTVIIAGAAAWMAGRAVALTWRPAWQAMAYALLLGAADRFFYFALLSHDDKLGKIAQTELLSPMFYALDAVTLIGIALLAYRFTRARQMVAQYPWLYRPAGPLGYAEIPQEQD